jgi:hypothetical protein
VLSSILIPSYASKGYTLHELPQLNAYILTHPIKSYLRPYLVVFNLIPLLLLLAILGFGSRVKRLFAGYVAFTYLISAIMQNISISVRYGIGIIVSNLLLFSLVATAWLHEAIIGRNAFSPRIPSWTRIPLLGIAILSIWLPIHPETLQPDFHPSYLLTSGSGMSFCMMTTFSLSSLLYFYPEVNLTTLRVTSLVGFLIGLGNLGLEFFNLPQYFWVGLFHIPLVFLSLFGWLLSRSEA